VVACKYRKNYCNNKINAIILCDPNQSDSPSNHFDNFFQSLSFSMSFMINASQLFTICLKSLESFLNYIFRLILSDWVIYCFVTQKKTMIGRCKGQAPFGASKGDYGFATITVIQCLFSLFIYGRAG